MGGYIYNVITLRIHCIIDLQLIVNVNALTSSLKFVYTNNKGMVP